MKKVIAAFSLLLLVGGGCMSKPAAQPDVNVNVDGSGTVDGSGAAGGAAGIEIDSRDPVGSWKLVSLKKPGEELMDAATLNSTLEFKADGTFSAQICNSMSGKYTVTGNEMRTSEVASTLMLCTGPAGDIEAAFTADLGVVMGVSRTGETLMLNGPTGNVYAYARM